MDENMQDGSDVLEGIAFVGETLGPFFLQDPKTGEAGAAFQALAALDVDVASGQWTQLNQQRREVLCFSEEAPRLALMGGRIYYLDFDNQRSATRLCSVDLEGADHKVLAQGYSWLNVEA